MVQEALHTYEAQYSLAISAIDALLWGEARLHIEHLLNHGDIKEACVLMAKLEEMVHPEDVSLSQQWLRRALACEGDYVWVCKSCNSSQEKWAALCQRCSEFDTLEWKLTKQPYRKIDYVDVLTPDSLPFNSNIGDKFTS